MKSKPQVAIIGTGGTISSVGIDRLDLVRYVDNKKIYEVDELIDAFPEVGSQADLLPVPLRAIPSTSLGPVEWLEINTKIHEAIERLPEHFRIVTVLRDIEKLPYEEISDIVDVPLGTVKSRINRARIQLQKDLKDYI